LITKIYIDNFKCFTNFELELKEISLFLGNNGSGKSSVFDVLYRLRRLIAGEANVGQLFPEGDLTRWENDKRFDLETQSFKLEINGNDGKYSYYLEILHNIETHTAIIKNEVLLFNDMPLLRCDEDLVEIYDDNHAIFIENPPNLLQSGIVSLEVRPGIYKLMWFKEHISKFIIAKIQPQTMTSDSAGEENILSRNMDNFSSWYRYLLKEHRPHIISLNKELKEVIPGFHSFSMPHLFEMHKTLKVRFSGSTDKDPIIDYQFDELSDGQRVIIVLYTLLFGIRNLGYSLYLDEPENYLALSEIQPWLMAVVDACEQDFSQIILVSHHPELINYLGASAGIWFERNANGPVSVKEKLDDGGTGLGLSETIARGWNE
jgi:predicted ATPase